MKTRVTYHKASVPDAVRAAKELESAENLYVFATHEGTVIASEPPPFGQQHIIVKPGGTAETVAHAYVPTASPGSPEAGLQVDMMGKTTLVQPKSRGTAVTASMEDFAKLEAMKAEARPKGKASVRYHKGSAADAVRAAKELGADTNLYVYATAEGMAIAREKPPFGQQHVVIKPDGSHQSIPSKMVPPDKPEAAKVKPKPAPKPKAEVSTMPTGGRTLSYADAAELLAGLELRADAIAERLEQGSAELESMKESLDPRLAKLTALIPATKEGRSEITHITKGQYRKVWGREPKSQILTADGKRVRWEYALDEIAQELHLEEKASREGVNPDEYVKGLIEDARDAKQMIAATEHELRSDQATLKAIERLKLDVKSREGEVTSAPLVASMAASKPKPRTKAEVKAKGMLAEEAMKLIAKVQASRSPGAIAMDNSILANRVLPMSKAHIWAKAPNRYDIKGIDTPGRGGIVSGVGYTDKGGKRLSRKPRKGWRKVKYT